MCFDDQEFSTGKSAGGCQKVNQMNTKSMTSGWSSSKDTILETGLCILVGSKQKKKMGEKSIWEGNGFQVA